MDLKEIMDEKDNQRILYSEHEIYASIKAFLCILTIFL